MEISLPCRGAVCIITMFQVERYGMCGLADGHDAEGLQIASLIINFIALTLATLTSLDWRTQKTQDHQFAARLGKVAPNVHIADSVNWGRAPRDGADFV